MSTTLDEAHGRYIEFFEFGDAVAYREGLERLRAKFESSDAGSRRDSEF